MIGDGRDSCAGCRTNANGAGIPTGAAGLAPRHNRCCLLYTQEHRAMKESIGTILTVIHGLDSGSAVAA